MKNKTLLIAILGMASLALSAQQSKATIIELSMQEAAKIKGGSCNNPTCQSGGICVTGSGCGTGCTSATYEAKPSYKECAAPNTASAPCNAGAEGTGCGEITVYICEKVLFQYLLVLV